MEDIWQLNHFVIKDPRYQTNLKHHTATPDMQ